MKRSVEYLVWFLEISLRIVRTSMLKSMNCMIHSESKECRASSTDMHTKGKRRLGRRLMVWDWGEGGGVVGDYFVIASAV